MDGNHSSSLFRPILSERQLQILQLAALGINYKNIALQLGLSPHTIRNHMHNIHKKLGFKTTAQSLAICYKAGLIR